MLNVRKDKKNIDAKVDCTLRDESISPSEMRKPGLRIGHRQRSAQGPFESRMMGKS